MRTRALLVLAVAAACTRSTAELQLVDIKQGDLVIGVVVTGELAAVDSTDVKPPQLDDVWELKIASLAPEGVDVKVGDPLAGFDPSELMRMLENIENDVQAAEKQLEKKRADMALARKEEALDIAQSEAALRRATLKTAAPTDLVASNDLKLAQLDEKSARLALELARTKAQQAQRTDAAEVGKLVDKLAQNTRRAAQIQSNIAKLKQTAPRAGTVLYPEGRNGEKRKVGDSVWRAGTVVQIVGLDKMIGKGEVDEVDIARIAAKQPVALRLDALPDVQLRGRIDSIARAVKPRSKTDPSKILELKLALDPVKAALRPGMRFRGQIETERVANVVLAPVDAVFVTPEGPVAYRADRRGAVTPVRLTLGRRSATLVEVKAGLAPGDRVTRVDPRTGS